MAVSRVFRLIECWWLRHELNQLLYQDIFCSSREKTPRPERTCIARQNLLYCQENFIFICSKLFSFMYRMTHNHSFLKQQYSITNFKLCSYIFCDRRFNIDNLLVLESFKKSSQVMPSMLLALAFQSIFCYTF